MRRNPWSSAGVDRRSGIPSLNLTASSSRSRSSAASTFAFSADGVPFRQLNSRIADHWHGAAFSLTHYLPLRKLGLFLNRSDHDLNVDVSCRVVRWACELKSNTRSYHLLITPFQGLLGDSSTCCGKDACRPSSPHLSRVSPRAIPFHPRVVFEIDEIFVYDYSRTI